VNKAIKQGGPDGLCGIYCLINHMRAWELGDDNRTNDQEALRYLLQAAQSLGFLDPHRLVNGYEVFEILLIFNRVAEWLRRDVRAVHLDQIGKKIGSGKLRKVCEWVFTVGGEVIVSEKDGGHWLLAISSNMAELKVMDSDPSNASVSRKYSEILQELHGLALIRNTFELASEA
jgi:hypothetical protein